MRIKAINRNIILALLILQSIGNILVSQNINRPNVEGPAGIEVNTYSGNLYYGRQDLSLPGIGLPLGVKFSYNTSRDSINLGYGLGWSMNYAMMYQVNGDSLMITTPDGREDLYVEDGNSYINPIGNYNNIAFPSPNILQLTTKRGIKFLFENDTHKKLTKIEDRNGNFITLAYTDDHPTIIANSSGSQITLQWIDGLLTSISDGSRTITYSYENDYLIDVLCPLGNTESYQYDLFGKMVILQDKDDYPVSIEYNSGMVSQLQSCLGKENFIYRDLSTYYILDASSGNQLTHYEYDTTGNNIQITFPHGVVSTFEYDSNNNLKKETDAKGNAKVYTYDANGNIISATNSIGSSISASYTPFSNIESSTDENGYVTTLNYDNAGNVTSIDFPDGTGNSFSYDSNGVLQNETDGNGDIISYVHDAYGNIIQVNYPIGTIDLVYDGRGNVTQMTDQNQETTTYVYDLEDRLLSMTNALGKSSLYEYDGRGNLTSFTDLNGNKTTYLYDGLNRLVEVMLPGSGSAQYEYDLNGNLTKIIDCNMNVNLFKYNAQNLISEFTDGLGLITQYDYDLVGNVIEKTYPNGNVVTYTYDDNDRLLSVSYPENSDYFEYDSRGNITLSSNDNITYNLAYDEMNRLAEINNVTWNKTIQYQYDGNGNRSTLIDPDNQNTTYLYNSNNLISSISNPFGSTTTFAYDLKNRLITQTNGNSSVTNYNYSELDYLLSLNNLKSSGDTISSFVYEYDDFGNRLSRTKAGGLQDNYTYDPTNRLTTIVYDDGNFEILDLTRLQTVFTK